MYDLNIEEKKFNVTLSSDFKYVDRVIGDILSFIKNETNSLNENDVRLMMREAINNSIEHGNLKDSNKFVIVSIEILKAGSFKIIVIDEGKGFDTSTLNYKMPENPEEIRSRGLPLISKISDRIEFNDIGNEVSIYIQAMEDNDAAIIENLDIEEGGEIKIIPGENITSTTASKIKTQLMEILEKKPSVVILDFTNVKEFDSIGLSIIAIFGRMLKTQNKDAEIKIENAKMEIVQLFLHTGLDKYFILF